MPDYTPSDPPDDSYAPVLDWPLFAERVFMWGQDEHVLIAGPTKQGKSNLAHHLLMQRDYIAYLGIKRKDATLSTLASKGGYTRIYEWPPTVGRFRKRPATWQEMPKRLVWPDSSQRVGSRVVQQRVFTACLDECWDSGGACVVWDDFWYIANILGMVKDAKQNLLNARSNESPQMFIAQRGQGNRVVELLDQPEHLFFARETNESDLRHLGPRNSIRRGFVEHLDRYQFLYENSRTGDRYRVTAPLIGA